MLDERTSQAIDLMTEFADRTGLTSSHSAKRYSWTDAFAVCNFIGLARTTGDGRYADFALALIDQVHHKLGKHRPDSSRQGWLSGLSEEEGEAHPTAGGLRIGKPMSERGETEPLDPDLEWSRDGQYFHYLTKWMHALDLMSRATGRPKFNAWARELAEVAHRAFTYGARGDKRMIWKVSTDLSRAQVSSMGHHDPLDGLVTCAQLEATTEEFHLPLVPDLSEARADFAEMLDSSALETTDALGIGSLLVDACRLTQLQRREQVLVLPLLAAATTGLRQIQRRFDARAPASRRLAFRELGLAIGLAAVRTIECRSGSPLATAVADLMPYTSLGTQIESFWLEPEHRCVATWVEHQDINEVMLATRLAPDGFLTLLPPKRPSDSPPSHRGSFVAPA